MPNTDKDKKNQPPTGEGKKQSPRSGAANKLNKRSDVLQAQRGHSELNIGTAEDEMAAAVDNPRRPKAAR
jgi:hypothetical protein